VPVVLGELCGHRHGSVVENLANLIMS
jgi:hypothetical protein